VTLEGALLNMLEQPSMVLSMELTMCELGIAAMLLLLVPAPWWCLSRGFTMKRLVAEDDEPNGQIFTNKLSHFSVLVYNHRRST